MFYAYEKSLADERDLGDTKLVFEYLLEPLLASTQDESVQGVIYRLNCSVLIQSALMFDFCADRLEQIEATVQELVKRLIGEQYKYILHQSGLSQLTQDMQQAPPLSRQDGCDRNTLTQSMSKLDSFLVSVTDVNHILQKVASLDLSRQISKGGLTMFLSTYKDLERKILDPVNKYEYPASILSRSAEEVETLLSLHDDY
jgi:hypothetical protein